MRLTLGESSIDERHAWEKEHRYRSKQTREQREIERFGKDTFCRLLVLRY